MSGASKQQQRFDLDKLFEGYLHLLQTEAEYFSRLTEHNAELGRMNETHLVKLLRRYLPAKFGIGTGFIQCGGSERRQSPQCDIIIYDAINNAPFYSSDAWSIFPIEMMYGVIEVKTTLDQDGLKKSFEDCAILREMAGHNQKVGNKSYLSPIVRVDESGRGTGDACEYRDTLPPRFFVFGYKGWTTLNGANDAYVEAKKDNPSAFIHGLCWLGEEKTCANKSVSGTDRNNDNERDDKSSYVESYI